MLKGRGGEEFHQLQQPLACEDAVFQYWAVLFAPCSCRQVFVPQEVKGLRRVKSVMDAVAMEKD